MVSDHGGASLPPPPAPYSAHGHKVIPTKLLRCVFHGSAAAAPGNLMNPRACVLISPPMFHLHIKNWGQILVKES